MASGPLNGVFRHVRGVARAHWADETSDGQLLERFICRREDAAFEALVLRHGPMVLGVCRRVLRRVHDAEDAFQATFLVLARKASGIRRRELVGNWLYGTAYRAALEAKAARRRVREAQVSLMPETEVIDDDADWRELRPILDRELNRLPDKYRVAVVLCDLEGGTRRDVARQLGIPEGTLSGRLTTARRLLAKRLARLGPVLSGGVLGGVLSTEAAMAGVPSLLVQSTVKAASLFVVRDTVTAGAATAKVVALTEGVMKSMLLTKIKFVTAAVIVAGLLASGAGAGLGLRPARAADSQPSPGQKKTDAPKPVIKPDDDPGSANMDKRIAVLEMQIRVLTEALEDLRGVAKPATDQRPAAKAQIKIFKLRHADAEEIAKTLQQLFPVSSPNGGLGNGGKTLRIATYAGNNSVLVQGENEDMDAIGAVIEQLDDQPIENRKPKKGLFDPPTEKGKPKNPEQ